MAKSHDKDIRKVVDFIKVDDIVSQCPNCKVKFSVASNDKREIKCCPYCGYKREVMRMNKQQAKRILKNTGYIGNEVGVAFDVAVKSMDKLEKIEQIIDAEMRIMESDLLWKIKEVLEKE